MQSVRPTFCRMASPACGPTRAIVCYVRGLKAALAIKRCAHRSHRLHAMLLEISLQHGLRLGRHLLDRPAEPAGIRTHRAPERLRARLPAVCDLWEWVDVGTHGVRERHERRRVPDASPLTTEVLQRLSACAHSPTHRTANRPYGRAARTGVRTYPADSSTAKPASVSSSSAAASVSSGSSISARSAWQRAVRRREARQGRPCALSSARHVFRFRLRYSKPRAAAAAGIPAEPGPTSGSSRRSASPHSR